MSIKNKLFITFLVLLNSFKHTYALTFGSTTAVAVVAGVQVVANGANTIQGFTSFVGGVTIPNATSNFTYNNFFPFYGPVTMNNGTIILSRNLTLGSNATFPNGGNIIGNSLSLNLPINVNPFVINAGTIMNSITLVVNSPLQLNAPLVFAGNCVIEGNGNIIDCTAGALAVGVNGSLMIQNATLKGVSNNRLYCYDNTGSFTLENVSVALNSTLTFSQGRLDFLSSNIFTGTQIFLYQSQQPATIRSNAMWMFDTGMTFSYATTSNSLLAFDDITAVLKLYETTLYANTPGLRLTKGTMILDGACPLINDASASINGISIGDGVSSSNNLVLNVLAESGINLNRGFFVNNNV